MGGLISRPNPIKLTLKRVLRHAGGMSRGVEKKNEVEIRGTSRDISPPMCQLAEHVKHTVPEHFVAVHYLAGVPEREPPNQFRYMRRIQYLGNRKANFSFVIIMNGNAGLLCFQAKRPQPLR